MLYPQTPTEVADSAIEKFKIDLPELQSSLRYNLYLAFIVAVSGVVYGLYTTLNGLVDYLFPDTAPLPILRRIGAIFGVPYKVATSAKGNAVFWTTPSAAEGVILPIATELSGTNGVVYRTQQAITVTPKTSLISQLIVLEDSAICTVASTASLGSGMQVLIENANTSAFNGTKRITVLSATQFSFLVPTTSPSSDASNTLLAKYVSGVGEIRSTTEGAATNLVSGSALNYTTASPLQENPVVDRLGVTGGSDDDTTDEYRSKVLFQYQNRVTQLNEPDIVSTIKDNVPGCTRVKVYPVTPRAGYVTVYPLFEDRASIAPNTTERETIKELLLAKRPPNVPSDAIIIGEVAQYPIDFTISNLVPASDALRAAIAEELQLYFKTEVTVGQTVSRDVLVGVIRQVPDPSTGAVIQNLTLATPVADVPVVAGGLATLGTVGFI